MIKDEKKSADAARALASTRFDSTYLDGTGGAEWRFLWEASRSYSELRAYMDHKSPYLGGGARCVLCQQYLGDEAKKRQGVFEAFCKNTSQQLAEQAAARIVNHIQAPSPKAEIKSLQVALELHAKTEKSADDPTTRTKLLKEQSELEAREWFAGVKADVLKSHHAEHRVSENDLFDNRLIFGDIGKPEHQDG